MNKKIFKIEKNEDGLILLVDIDDLLVESSDKLQEVLDSKTNFKTTTLKMLEQLKRNCSYLLNEIVNECELAKSEKRTPNLGKFPIFDNFKLIGNDIDEIYTRLILSAKYAAKYYLDVADKFYNQFLEERDTFLEIDNLPKGQIFKFNYQKEMDIISNFAELYFNNKDMFHKINIYCYEKMLKIVNDAKRNNYNGKLTIPEYGLLVSSDSNDIIKKNSLNNQEILSAETLYDKPIRDMENCILNERHLYDVITNAKVFINPSEEIVDYIDIHSIKNVKMDAVRLVKKLIYSGMFKGVYFSTHHNGLREENAKIKLMNEIIPEADGFIGQRFHATNHDGIRRGRSSKVDVASERLQVPISLLALLDDSKANCKDCKDKDGTEIFYKPQNDSEIINGKLEFTGLSRILNFDEYLVFDIISKAYEKLAKQKRKIK